MQHTYKQPHPHLYHAGHHCGLNLHLKSVNRRPFFWFGLIHKATNKHNVCWGWHRMRFFLTVMYFLVLLCFSWTPTMLRWHLRRNLDRMSTMKLRCHCRHLDLPVLSKSPLFYLSDMTKYFNRILVFVYYRMNWHIYPLECF